MEIRVLTLLALFGILGTFLGSIATADAAREGSWVSTKDDPFDSANRGGTLQLLEDGFQAYSSLQNRRLLRDGTRRKLLGKGDGDYDTLELIGKKVAGDEAHRRLMSLWKGDEDVYEEHKEAQEEDLGSQYGGDDRRRKLLITFADEAAYEEYEEANEEHLESYGGDEGRRKLLGKGDGDYDTLKLRKEGR